MTKTKMWKRLVGLIGVMMVVVLAGCSPEMIQAQTNADIQKLNAQVAAERTRVENEAYARTADERAQLELARERERQGLLTLQERQTLEAEHAKQLAQIEVEKSAGLAAVQAGYDAHKAELEAHMKERAAEAEKNVLIAGGLALGLALGLGGGALAIAFVAWGIGRGITLWAENRGKAIYPDENGHLPVLVKGGMVHDLNRMVGPVLALHQPSLIERLMLLRAQIRAGEIPQLPAPQIMMPLSAPLEAQMQITTQAQAVQLTTAAGGDGEVRESARSTVRRMLTGSLTGRLPAPRLISDPVAIQAFEAMLESRGEET